MNDYSNKFAFSGVKRALGFDIYNAIHNGTCSWWTSRVRLDLYNRYIILTTRDVAQFIQDLFTLVTMTYQLVKTRAQHVLGCVLVELYELENEDERDAAVEILIKSEKIVSFTWRRCSGESNFGNLECGNEVLKKAVENALNELVNKPQRKIGLFLLRQIVVYISILTLTHQLLQSQRIAHL